MRKSVVVAVMTAAAMGAIGLWLAQPSQAASSDETKATLKAADGTTIGVVSFRTLPKSKLTEVYIRIDKPPTATTKLDEQHGVHIHANDDASNGSGCVADPKADPKTWFTSADGHFKDASGKMIGDLPNVILDKSGTSQVAFTVDYFTPADVVGKAVVMHAGPSNYGNIPIGTEPEQYTPNSADATKKTAATGNAGDRLACGVVEGPAKATTSTDGSKAKPGSARTAPDATTPAKPASPANPAAKRTSLETPGSASKPTTDTSAVDTINTITTNAQDANTSGGSAQMNMAMPGM